MTSRLDRLRALHAAATPGPWHAGPIYWTFRQVEKSGGDVFQHMDGTDLTDEETCGIPCKADSDSIAANHNALPSLLACVDALREAKELIAELRGYASNWNWKYGEGWDEEEKNTDAALAPLLEEQP